MTLILVRITRWAATPQIATEAGELLMRPLLRATPSETEPTPQQWIRTAFRSPRVDKLTRASISTIRLVTPRMPTATMRTIIPSTWPGAALCGDFSFNINGNCSGTCLSSGSWSYNGSLNAARSLLGEEIIFHSVRGCSAGFGGGAHPVSTQHRFGGAACHSGGCPNSPHLSVPYDPNGTLEPRNKYRPPVASMWTRTGTGSVTSAT